MSWIKLEKDLLTDPRFMRMALAVESKVRAECNASALQGVTLALGALARLWMLADTHLSQDDILPMGADDVDQLVGIPGFHTICPTEWLEVVDAHHVKLPGYQSHNDPNSKKRALGQKRAVEFRKRNASALHQSNAKPLHSRNGHALHETRVERVESAVESVAVSPSASPSLALSPPLTPPSVDLSARAREVFELPSGVNLAAWDEWLTYRQRHKLPRDAQTLRQHCKLLLRYSQTIQREIIETSIGSSWQGLFAPKGRDAPKADLLKDWQPPTEPTA